MRRKAYNRLKQGNPYQDMGQVEELKELLVDENDIDKIIDELRGSLSEDRINKIFSELLNNESIEEFRISEIDFTDEVLR